MVAITLPGAKLRSADGENGGAVMGTLVAASAAALSGHVWS